MTAAAFEATWATATDAVPSASPPLLFRWEPPVSAHQMSDWQRDIDRVVPPHDRTSRLVLRWEPGDRWQPIQRFIIWQAEDPNTVHCPAFVVDLARGPHPRSTGHYCAPGWCQCGEMYRQGRPGESIRTHTYAWRGGVSGIDRATWEFYRDTGLIGRRWWTIQGTRGGHRFVWAPGELESQLSTMMGGPQQTPPPGALPYAPCDGRTLAQLAVRDRLSTWNMALDFATRSVDHLEAEDRRDVLAARQSMWRWIDTSFDDAWSEGGHCLKHYVRDTYGRARVDEDIRIDYEQVEQSFMESEWD